MDTQDIHHNGRNFAILDLLPNTPYQACVAVLCKDELRKPGLDHCVTFSTKVVSTYQLPRTTVVGLAVGIPLLLVILCLVAAIVIVLKKRGPFSSEHEAGHTPERPQRQELMTLRKELEEMKETVSRIQKGRTTAELQDEVVQYVRRAWAAFDP
ncbi:uncharacterized protein LOC144914873 [Branchiostoma floridae x Branchiostoma belcheri]